MPVVYELFGRPVTVSKENASRIRRAECPFMSNHLCDGGGNRDMVRWPASQQPLATLFDNRVGVDGNGFIPCGVCSVSVSSTNWAVCPRRLLSFRIAPPSAEPRPLWQRIMQVAGFESGDSVRVWSEITLTGSDGVKYRLDYVLKSESKPPVIVEVMTASTSGGNRARLTDMQSAFCRAVLFANGTTPELGSSPGVNVRQVWARMASQLVVKSEVANAWGGRAIWVIQDALMSYIRRNTGLRVDELYSPSWETDEINVICASIDDPNDVRLYAGPIQSNGGEACWSDLLRTPSIPKIENLMSRLRDDNMIATLEIH